jgi:hypothetical protein
VVREGGNTDPHILNLGTRWMWVISSYIFGKTASGNTGQKVGWFLEVELAELQREKFPPLP